MTRSKRRLVLPAAALALTAIVLTAATARADRRPPYGMDSVLLESQVRESIERRITPLLEQMAPGQAELKYVDVRVTRPTALPAGASPGFEETAPGAEFVAEKAEISLILDAKLPAALPQGPQEPDQEPPRGRSPSRSISRRRSSRSRRRGRSRRRRPRCPFAIRRCRRCNSPHRPPPRRRRRQPRRRPPRRRAGAAFPRG